jgi:hypothetical protein
MAIHAIDASVICAWQGQARDQRGNAIKMMINRWKLAGICIDTLFAIILIQQAISVWTFSRIYPHRVINFGIVCGGFFLFLTRLLIFHAFENPIRLGSIIRVRPRAHSQMGTVTRIGLLFSTVLLKDGQHVLIWNIETGLCCPQPARITSKHQNSTADVNVSIFWETSRTDLLMTLFDGLFLLLCLLPTAWFLLRGTPEQLRVFANAAMYGATYSLLIFSAQLGLLRYLQAPSKEADGNEDDHSITRTPSFDSYHGLFVTLNRNHHHDNPSTVDRFLVLSLNAGQQVAVRRVGGTKLPKACSSHYYGPYI